MKTVAEIRRSNLESLVAELGSLESVADAASSSAIYLSQVKHQTIDRKTGKPRQMGGAIARRLEVGCNKPEGWMDRDHATVNITIPGFSVAATASNQAPALMSGAGTATNNEALQQQAVDLISSVMDMMDDAQREVMAGKLASWARAPDSPKIKKSIAESLASASKPKNTTND